MKIVVDTNIIFSAILNIDSRIGKLLIHGFKYFDFYSCEYLYSEIKYHQEKLKKASKLSDTQLEISRSKIFKKIHLINHNIISSTSWARAEPLVLDIDPDDISFVALTLDLKGSYLWTGDKKLLEGLRQQNFESVINTQEMLELYDNLKQIKK